MTTTKALPLLKVTTAHSEYVIDQNTRTFTRTPVHEKANDLSRYIGDREPYVEAAIVKGERMILTLPDGSCVFSTTVQSVEEVTE